MIYSLKRFSNWDERSIESQNRWAQKFANFQKKTIDKIGLGNTKLGRAMKRNIDIKTQAGIDKANSDLQFRRELYNYKSNKKSKEQ